ncbi:hypothetical protein EPI10_023782 [Gossypium australe]|uniref:Uncharacterized protein n=1 Tax=Gossypium australe TaxID=47621 RepID=A0A5B6VWN8_9ROSI|nr:hypothetical protein EPI10_023782 [Gossypium australe]
MPTRPNYHLEYSQQAQKPPPSEPSSNLENLLKAYMVKNDALIQGQKTTLKNLENEVGQLANELRSRPQGALSSDTKNLRNACKEHYKFVTLKSGKMLESKEFEAKNEPSNSTSKTKVAAVLQKSGLDRFKTPQPPYPQRF